MPVRLAQPFEAKAIDLAKIAAWKTEDNHCLGTHWTEVWVVWGYCPEGGEAHQVVHPDTGAAALELKIEDGKHPLANDQALGKCDVCGKWYRAIAGGCTDPDCHGRVAAYDGWTRLSTMEPEAGLGMKDGDLSVLYRFLSAEKVPDPYGAELGDELVLLDGEKVAS